MPKPLRPTFGKIALATLVIGLVVGGALAYGLYRLAVREFPDVSVLNTRYPVTLYQGAKQPVKVRLQNTPPPGWTKITQISKPAMGAVVVSEDWAFFSHEGFDANQLREAIKEDISDRKFSRGASTITMQVVKNVFLTHEKTLYRKAKEFVLAIRLDQQVSKRKVLEVYFNIAEWGHGIFGIGAAARHYFNKAPADLTPKEGAFLAMLLPSPKRYSQSFRDRKLSPYARKTVNSILNKMVQAGYITAEERELENEKPLTFEMASETPTTTPEESSTFDPELSPPEGEEEEIETPRELDLSESGG